jgi:hypothetical protein
LSELPRAGSGAVAFSLACSLLAAAPAIVRVHARPFPFAVVVLVASASLIVIPLGVWIRPARSRGVGGMERALLAGLALCALPLALFGGVLKSTTHHRPLGGATFAVAGLCVLALCVALSIRVLGLDRETLGKPGKFSWPNLFFLGCGLSLGAVMVLGLARDARPSLVDFCALALATTFAGFTPLPHKLTRWSPWPAVAWLVLLVCAVVLLKGAGHDQTVVGSLATQAPVLFAPLSWLGGGS